MSEAHLRDHLGYWLRRVSDDVHGNFQRQIAAHDITVAQWSVLVTVHRGEATTTTDVARFVGIDVGAVSRLIDRLAAKGLITRTPDPASRRTAQLALTPAGTQLVPVLAAIADSNDQAFFAVLSAAEQVQLLDLLQRIFFTHHNDQHQGTPR